jgi:hypothetical protein
LDINAWGSADRKISILKCKTYLGEKEKRNSQFLLGQEVTDMMEDYRGLLHCIHFQNVFTSTELKKLLLERKSHASGRKNSSKEFSQPKQLKEKYGESR